MLEVVGDVATAAGLEPVIVVAPSTLPTPGTMQVDHRTTCRPTG